MTSSSSSRGSKHRTQKACSSPSYLAGQFREIQRLRKKVCELEKRQQNGALKNIAQAKNDNEKR
jgi:hypothetical protein